MALINMNNNSLFGEFRGFSCEEISPIIEKIKNGGLKSIDTTELVSITEHIRTCKTCLTLFNQSA